MMWSDCKIMLQRIGRKKDMLRHAMTLITEAEST